MTDLLSTSDGPTAMADIDVCLAVSQDLQKHYPGHMWAVGCNHEAGTVVIDLPYEKPLHLRNYGMLLHLSTLMGAGGQAAAMRAGGELLERFGLKRGAATAESAWAAREHGLITDAAVVKSRGSTI